MYENTLNRSWNFVEYLWEILHCIERLLYNCSVDYICFAYQYSLPVVYI